MEALRLYSDKLECCFSSSRFLQLLSPPFSDAVFPSPPPSSTPSHLSSRHDHIDHTSDASHHGHNDHTSDASRHDHNGHCKDGPTLIAPLFSAPAHDSCPYADGVGDDDMTLAPCCSPSPLLHLFAVGSAAADDDNDSGGDGPDGAASAAEWHDSDSDDTDFDDTDFDMAVPSPLPPPLPAALLSSDDSYDNEGDDEMEDDGADNEGDNEMEDGGASFYEVVTTSPRSCVARSVESKICTGYPIPFETRSEIMESPSLSIGSHSQGHYSCERSSSSCLSLLSESDLFDEPSTSGCSSEMASMMQSREKKRQRVKAMLRELKAMVPNHSSGKVDTLGTLNFVVSSMRKISDELKQEKSQEFKAPSVSSIALPTLQCPEAAHFRIVNDGVALNTQSELTVMVSIKNHIVLHTSAPLMELLGYPPVWWKGRLLNDFVHKKDVATLNSYINESCDNLDSTTIDLREPSVKAEEGSKPTQPIFYIRVRRCRSLSSGFSITNTSGSYNFFKVMASSKMQEPALPDSSSEDQNLSKRGVMLYFAHMTSPYKGSQLPADPEQRSFSLRHSLFCTYTFTHANTVALLGHLPQEIVGSSIFDYYHSDDLPQLLDIYKKAMTSMGHPFKSGPLRLQTRNGTYVKVTTEWSSFMNPWDHKLEFIIAQHTIVKSPDKPNVFEECSDKPTNMKRSETSRKLMDKIRDVLQKPMMLESGPLTPTDSSGQGTLPLNSSQIAPSRDNEKTKEKVKADDSQCLASSSDVSSSMDEKSISSLYNQVNYSLNIKRFLLSHPKTFPVSDEESSTDVVQKDDSEEEMNKEVEMQVEIPVLPPLSSGSSTQVHVSEVGFPLEDAVLSPPPLSFGGEEAGPPRSKPVDNTTLCLTQDSLRKHTKAQELLYLQEASKVRPHLFQLKTRRTVAQRNRQKRSRPTGHDDTTEVFKFARNAKGQRGVQGATATTGIYRSIFPITAVDVKPTSTQPISMGMKTTGPPSVVGVVPSPFQTGGMTGQTGGMTGLPGLPGMGVMPQLTMLPIDPSTGLHLQPFMPAPSSNMQWPYYPQSGYSLLPQVMAGFYQPMLQPVAMTPSGRQPTPSSSTLPPTAASASSSAFSHPCILQQPMQQQLQQQQQKQQPPHLLREHIQWVPSQSSCSSCCSCQGPVSHSRGRAASGRTKAFRKAKDQQKRAAETTDNQMSSSDDTSSSIQYLLDTISANNSSPNEEREEKLHKRMRLHSQAAAPRRQQVVPRWLQTVQWVPELRMTYTMSAVSVQAVLKKDLEALKKMVQPEHIKDYLENLLDEVDNRDLSPMMDEEADFMYPGLPDSSDTEGEKTPTGSRSPTADFTLGAVEGMDCSGGDGGGGNSSYPTTAGGPREEEQASSSAGPRPEPACRKAQRAGHGHAGQTVEVVMTECATRAALHAPARALSGPGSRPRPRPCPLGEEEGEGGDKDRSSGGKGEGEGEGEGGRATTSSPKSSVSAVAMERKNTTALSDDGCSDAGSDNSRQKNEDAQSSSSSKVSSNLTPSDERSTGESGSSMKESDTTNRPKQSFSSSSTASSSENHHHHHRHRHHHHHHSNNNDKMSTDSGAETATPVPDVLEKLFVPLKVRVSLGCFPSERNAKKVQPLPFWLQEASLSEHVAFHYHLRPLDLDTVLANDRRRLSDMQQPQAVKCQLLELLTDVKAHHRVSSVSSSSQSLHSWGGASSSEVSESGGGHGHGHGHGHHHVGGDEAMTTKTSGGDVSSNASSLTRLMQPPMSARARALKMEGAGAAKEGAGSNVKKQLMDKLQRLTPGQRSEDWPGDVIINKVFLPTERHQASDAPPAENPTPPPWPVSEHSQTRVAGPDTQDTPIVESD